MATRIKFLACCQDPIYGISLGNIALTLTFDNWREKAAVRALDGRALYVWITEGETLGRLKTQPVYLVQVWERDAILRDLSATFPEVEQALAYANGEVEGSVLAASRPVVVHATRPGAWGLPERSTKRIIDTSPKVPRIAVRNSLTQPRIDPEMVARAFGAEPLIDVNTPQPGNEEDNPS